MKEISRLMAAVGYVAGIYGVLAIIYAFYMASETTKIIGYTGGWVAWGMLYGAAPVLVGALLLFASDWVFMAGRMK
jgi:hypothetical protein